MNSKRLKAILKFLNKEDCVIDIGCDHAYISIESAKLGCQRVLATDISPGALEIAKRNIQDNHLEERIELKLADGLEGIDSKEYNTIVISGMGTSTIKSILQKEKLKTIKKIILQSNNDLYELRKYMNEIGYSLEDEIILKEKKHYYTVMKYKKTSRKQTLQEEQYYFGLYQTKNREYYKYLAEKLDFISQQIPPFHLKEKEENQKQKELLKRYLMKENGSS